MKVINYNEYICALEKEREELENRVRYEGSLSSATRRHELGKAMIIATSYVHEVDEKYVKEVSSMAIVGGACIFCNKPIVLSKAEESNIPQEARGYLMCDECMKELDDNCDKYRLGK